MRKFTENELFRAKRYGDMDYLTQVMQNQNEIIDWIANKDEDVYIAMAKESHNESNPTRRNDI